MSQINNILEEILHEVVFRASRSSGPGGQNVNKVNTRVTLEWDVASSTVLSPEQKEVLLHKWSSRLSAEGLLQISSQESRSQLKNKDLAIKKLNDLLKAAFAIRKKRKPSKPSKTAVQERLKKKKMLSEKKERRRRPL